MSALILILSAVALAATACRLDHLTWRQAPGAMFVHVLCGAGAAWPFTSALDGSVDAAHGATAVLSLLWLAGTYRTFERQFAETKP
jgi:hypothetical protein